jgi:Vps51/Vps67
MALSTATLEHLLEAESHLRAAIRNAASSEKPLVVKQLSQLLLDMEQCKKIEEIMDMLEDRKPGSKGNFGSFFDED